MLYYNTESRLCGWHTPSRFRALVCECEWWEQWRDEAYITTFLLGTVPSWGRAGTYGYRLDFWLLPWEGKEYTWINHIRYWCWGRGLSRLDNLASSIIRARKLSKLCVRKVSQQFLSIQILLLFRHRSNWRMRSTSCLLRLSLWRRLLRRSVLMASYSLLGVRQPSTAESLSIAMAC